MTLTLAAETKTVRISVYATEDTQGMEKLARISMNVKMGLTRAV